MTITQTILALCARPDGATTLEMQPELEKFDADISPKRIIRRMKNLILQKRAVSKKASLNNDNMRVVYFISEEQAAKSHRVCKGADGWLDVYAAKLQAVLEQSPGLSRDELASMMDLKWSYVGKMLHVGARLGMIRASRKNGSVSRWYSTATPLAEVVLPVCSAAVLEKAATADGVTYRDGSKNGARNRYKLLRDEENGFLVHVAGVENNRTVKRYFTTRLLADEYAARNAALVAEIEAERKAEKAKREVVMQKRAEKVKRAAKPGIELVRRNPKPAQPGTKAETQHPRGEVIIPAGLQITRCPSPTFDKRYQIDPNERVLGGFATAGIGRYLEAA